MLGSGGGFNLSPAELTQTHSLFRGSLQARLGGIRSASGFRPFADIKGLSGCPCERIPWLRYFRICRCDPVPYEWIGVLTTSDEAVRMGMGVVLRSAPPDKGWEWPRDGREPAEDSRDVLVSIELQ